MLFNRTTRTVYSNAFALRVRYEKITAPDIVMIFLLLFAIASEARSSFSLEIQYIPLHVLNSVNDRILYIIMISILKLTLDIDNRNVHLKIILH